jgi:hypothetical protein
MQCPTENAFSGAVVIGKVGLITPNATTVTDINTTLTNMYGVTQLSGWGGQPVSSWGNNPTELLKSPFLFYASQGTTSASPGTTYH